MEGIKTGTIFQGKALVSGKREELIHDINVSLLSSNQQGRLAQLVDLIDNGGPNLVKLGIEIEDLGIDLGKNVTNGLDIGTLSGKVKVGVVVEAGDLLDVFLAIIKSLGGIGGEGFAGVGEKGLGRRGEEEGGTRGEGGGVGVGVG